MSSSFAVYLSNAACWSFSIIALESFACSFIKSDISIPNVFWISISNASTLASSSPAKYVKTTSSESDFIIFKILSFKFSPSRTSLLCSYIISLWAFITSSYFNTFFLMLKLRPSTFFWADSTALLINLFSIGTFSSIPIVLYTFVIMSPPKIFIRSSSNPI